MRVRILQPPHGYYLMPYSAAYLLKAYVEGNSPHRVDVDDLTARYAFHLWSGGLRPAAQPLWEAGRRHEGLLAEAVSETALAAWDVLRDEASYDHPPLVERNARLLQTAFRVDAAHDGLLGVPRGLPDRLGDWQHRLDAWQPSLTRGFLSDIVAEDGWADYDVLGITVPYLEQVTPALLLARLAKRAHPQLRVVLGGGAVTHILDSVIADPSFWVDVDYLVPYEGEHSLVALLDSLDAGTEPPATNIAHLEGDRVVYRKDLQGRPAVQSTFDFTTLEHRYPTPAPIIPVLTSKGCYWGKCAFCTHHEGYGQGYSRFTDTVTETTLTGLVDAGFSAFYLVDEALPPRTFGALVDIFQRQAGRTPQVRWTAEARVERSMTSDAAVAALAASGCRLLVNGIESGSQTVVNLMRKGVDLESVSTHARKCHAAGVDTGWMFFIGFPGETPEQAAETFRFIEANAEHLTYASVGSFVLEHGSPIHETPGTWDVVVRDTGDPYEISLDWSHHEVPDRDLTAELAALHRRYPQLDGLFTRAVDRSHALFYPPRVHEREHPPAEPVLFNSALTAGLVALDLGGHRLTVFGKESAVDPR